MHPRDWNRILLGLVLTTPSAYVAHAEVYLSENQAAEIFFPGVKLEDRWMELTPPEMKLINKNSGERVSSSRVRLWRGPGREVMFIDRVLGKHEFITYAVALLPEGKIKGVEILEYRETYGYEIREAHWRQKFTGKTLRDPLKVTQDIPNISGATLSSVHVTNGVRRILHTYEILKDKI